MPTKKPAVEVCLEVKTPDGEVMHLSEPLTIFDKSQSPYQLKKGFGDDHALNTLAKDSVYAVKGFIKTKDDTYVLCKPFAWLRWVEITEGKKPSVTPVSALDKFKTEE